MPPSSSDRNLLFGILALPMHFVSRDTLVAAMNAWVLDKSRSLGQVLVEQGKLAEDEFALLEGLVRKHLQKHNDDPQQSLAAVGAARPLGDDLAAVADDDVQANPLHLGLWVDAFRPVRHSLRPSLAAVFRGKLLPGSRQVAATVLAGYLADQPAQLAELLLDADDRQFALLVPLLRDRVAPVSARLLPELKPARRATTEAEQQQARRQAAAALTLWRLGQPEATWQLWRQTPTPEARSWLVVRTAAVGVPARQVIDRLGREEDKSARRALILALGEYTEKDLPAAQRQALVKQLLGCYRDDADPGIHGSIDWLLRDGKEGTQKRPLDWGQRRELELSDARATPRLGRPRVEGFAEHPGRHAPDRPLRRKQPGRAVCPRSSGPSSNRTAGCRRRAVIPSKHSPSPIRWHAACRFAFAPSLNRTNNVGVGRWLAGG